MLPLLATRVFLWIFPLPRGFSLFETVEVLEMMG